MQPELVLNWLRKCLTKMTARVIVDRSAASCWWLDSGLESEQKSWKMSYKVGPLFERIDFESLPLFNEGQSMNLFGTSQLQEVVSLLETIEKASVCANNVHNVDFTL